MKPRWEGRLGVYVGASRQGKTAAVKQATKSDSRVIVWSIKERVDRYAANWPEPIVVSTLADLLHLARHNARDRVLRVVYVPRLLADFDMWCRIAFAWGKARPCTVIAEELADVTSPAKAPDAWGQLVRQGLGWGIHIYAVTQRPAESDKTAIGNATYFHVHAMSRAKDRKYMAEEMDLPIGELEKLKRLQWIQKWNTGAIKRGVLTFPKATDRSSFPSARTGSSP